MRISSVGATTLHTQFMLWEWRWCYGNVINSINIPIILRINRSYYHSSCLNHNFGYYFEQIKKAPHYALPSYVVLNIFIMVAHISVAFISYFYYTQIFYFCQMKLWGFWHKFYIIFIIEFVLKSFYKNSS